MKRKAIVILSLLFVSMSILSPFSISADYSVNYQNAFAYAFWGLYGFDTVTPSTTITGNIAKYTITGSFNLNTNTVGAESPYSVYSSSNHNWLGYYHSSNGQTINYINSSGTSAQCTGCYIAIDLNTGGYYTNNVSLTVPKETITLTESGEPYIPYLTQSSAFPSITAYSNAYQQFFQNDIGTNSDDSIILSFIINKTVYVADAPILYDQNSNTNTYTVTRPYNQNLGSGSTRMCMYTYEFKGVSGTQKNNYFTVKFPSLEGLSNLQVLPIYFGAKSNMPEDIGKIVGVDVGIEHVVTEGNTESQTVESTLDNTNNDLSTSVGSFISMESGYLTDMNNSINNINFNNSLLTDTGLVNSMDWVRTQYWRLTNNNIIGTLVQYSLLIGLALLILGRR